jgi:nucleoside-diphosphate-sugar epimerase
MRLPVLGGTRFVGRAVVVAGAGRGWEVTTFNRGVSGADVAGARALRGDRTQAGNVLRLLEAGPWDAVVRIFAPMSAHWPAGISLTRRRRSRRHRTACQVTLYELKVLG